MSKQTDQQAASPHPEMKSLERLVGQWNLSGDAEGRVSYQWMEGGFFLLQHVDFVHNGHRIKGLEVIGHLRPFGEERSEEIMSRFYSWTGETLDYVYELKGNRLMIWGGQRGSPAYFQGTLSADGNTCTGGWIFPGGGYSTTMTRIGSA